MCPTLAPPSRESKAFLRLPFRGRNCEIVFPVRLGQGTARTLPCEGSDVRISPGAVAQSHSGQQSWLLKARQTRYQLKTWTWEPFAAGFWSLLHCFQVVRPGASSFRSRKTTVSILVMFWRWNVSHRHYFGSLWHLLGLSLAFRHRALEVGLDMFQPLDLTTDLSFLSCSEVTGLATGSLYQGQSPRGHASFTVTPGVKMNPSSPRLLPAKWKSSMWPLKETDWGWLCLGTLLYVKCQVAGCYWFIVANCLLGNE